MIRLFTISLALAAVLAGSAPASAQEKQKSVGGGVAYNIDAPESSFGFTAVAWVPVEGPNTPFKPLIIVPRFTDMVGLDYLQIDVDALWDIPVASTTNIHPYIGMGVGFARYDFGSAIFGGGSDSMPVLNLDSGFRFRKPGAKTQFLLETHYSSNIGTLNEMLINFVVLFPFGK